MPEVTGIAAVFQDQDAPCGAFTAENLKRQMEIAEANPNAPWKTKKKRRKQTETPRPKSRIDHSSSFVWPKEHKEDLIKAYGVPSRNPLPFKINLCDDGSVVTDEGEIIGTWQMDENAHPSFFPNGSSEPLFFDVFVGLLCKQIGEWHDANTAKARSIRGWG